MLAVVLAVIGCFSLANGQGNSQTVSVSNPCHPNPCALNQECIAVPGACMDPPCPLMATCQDTGPDPCASNPCPSDQKCLPDPKHCFMAPCPQYRCSKNAPDCTANETISNCGALCEPNCLDRGPKACPLICLPPACQCKLGYARSAGKCLLHTDCPRQSCPPNERMDPCGNLCEGTCENKFPMCIEMCAPPACVCMPGYYRQDGVCVPETQCQKKSCPPNEFWNSCGNLCESTCDNRMTICPAICAPPACVCEKGFYRDPTRGICVPENQCPGQSCPPNETMNSCGNLCEGSCDNKIPLCPNMCAPPACVCKTGFYRENGVCVPETQCKSSTNTKPGLCPMIKMAPNTVCREDCLKDEDCSGQMKCCGQCVKQCLTPLILK